jgi:ABC-type transporter Mla subunit MlaD
MQANQVKSEFPSIKRSVSEAAQLCQTTNDVPAKLRDALSQLNQQTDEASNFLEQETNDEKILQCIDELEELGDQAKNACRSEPVSEQVAQAVTKAHDAISDLQRRLH